MLSFNLILLWDLINPLSSLIKQDRDHRAPMPRKGNESTLVGILYTSVGHVLSNAYHCAVTLGTQLKVKRPDSPRKNI